MHVNFLILLSTKKITTNNKELKKHSYGIFGARMLWKPKEARIFLKILKNYRSTSVIW